MVVQHHLPLAGKSFTYLGDFQLLVWMCSSRWKKWNGRKLAYDIFSTYMSWINLFSFISFFLKKRSHWPVRCINLIEIEDADFLMMTRQLGIAKQWKKENSQITSRNEGRGVAGNSWVERLFVIWSTRGEIQHRITLKFNVCVMPPSACDALQYTIEEMKQQQSFLLQNELLSLIASVSRPFHSCVRSCLAWNESEAGVELLFYRNLLAFMSMMLFSCLLVGIYMKCSEVSIKIRSTPVSLSFQGQAAKYTTVKWSTERCRKWVIQFCFSNSKLISSGMIVNSKLLRSPSETTLSVYQYYL